MSRTRPDRRGWIKRSLTITVVGLIVLAGLIAGSLPLLNHFAPRYRSALAQRIGQRINSKVQMTGLEIGWGWHGPILYLDNPRITHRGRDAPALTAHRLDLEFSLIALIGGSLQPESVFVKGLKARLVQTDRGLHLAHWPRTATHGINWSKIAAVRRQLAEIRLSDSRITINSPRLPGGQMRWSNINAQLVDDSDRVLHADVSARGPGWWPTLNASLRLAGALRHPDRARFSVQAHGVKPLAFARHDRGGVAGRPEGGTVDLDLDGHWRGDRLTETTLKLSGRPLARRGQNKPLVSAFSAVFDVSSHPETHQLSLRLTHVSGGSDSAAAIAARARFNIQNHALQVDAKQLPGALTARLLSLAIPRLADTRIRGSIDDLRLAWAPQQPIAASLEFHGLRVDDPRISFGPIAGRYRQHGQQHTLRLAGAGAGGHLAAKHYIRGDLEITGLGGTVTWHPAAHGGWSVGLDQLRLASQKAHLTASGHVRLPKDSAPRVDITAAVVAPHMARLFKHVPEAPDLPNPRLRDWLPKAISAGALDHGHIAIKGPMNHFPFAKPRKNEGFHMRLSGHGINVRYKPDWPKITDARGSLTLDGDNLSLHLPAAHMLGVGLADLKARVNDVREPVMHVTARASAAPAPKLIAFITHSPLRDKFGKLARAIHVTGDDDLDVNLRLPLKPGLGHVKVAGRIDAKNNTLRQSALPAPITAIQGRLRFTGHGLSASGLSGRFMQVPFKADLSPASGGAQKIVAHAAPTLPGDRQALAHYLPHAWLVYGHGRAPLDVAFTVDRHGHVSPINISSDLRGMAVNLPAPLTKKADARAPLSVRVNASTHHIRAEYEHHLDLSVQLSDHGKPRRVQALLGATDLKPPDQNGLWIGGHADHVDGLGWFRVVRHVLYGTPVAAGIRQQQPKASSQPSSESRGAHALTFLGGNLTVDRLSFGNRYVPKTHVRAQPMGQSPGWRVNFEGHDSQGQITWTAAKGQPMRIAGNLKRIALHTQKPASHGRAGQSPTSTVLWPNAAPRDLPATQIYVQNFVVDHTSFGQLHLDARSIPNGWRLDRFQLADGALTGKLGAYWQKNNGVTRAGAQADFDGHGLSRLLRSIGHVSPVQAKNARIKADLSIKPNSQGLDLRYLSGQVHLGLTHGTLLTVNPGASRLLGLFNLYVLPRRLGLHFRDVVDKGMAFDKAHANFRIFQGQAYSDDTHIVTPSAKIGISGRVGLATRDYNEYVTITPKLGSGVALASAVLGGPIVGLAVFAVQELLKKPIQYFSSVGYTLKGSWDNPRIVDPYADGKTNKQRSRRTASNDRHATKS